MKWILTGLLFLNTAFAENSRIIPVFLEASELYIQGYSKTFIIRPDIKAAINVLEESKIDPVLLEKHTLTKSKAWPLREDDLYDRWVKSSRKIHNTEIPEVAVHAVRIKVVDETDDWFKDDVYAYFFITDGVIPTGKVTSIYKGIGQGQSFFFNEVDRAIFPLIGIPSKKPENHLIIDYGIIESDGDDIKELQKLSSVIIDIAIAVYTAYNPQNAQILINLRKEVKALAEMLIGLNKDDRLATGTIAYTGEKLQEMLKERSYVEVTKKHVSKAEMDTWDYRLTFRILRK